MDQRKAPDFGPAHVHVLNHGIGRGTYRSDTVLCVESMSIRWLSAELNASLFSKQPRIGRVERLCSSVDVVHRGSESTNKYIISTRKTRFTQETSSRTATQKSAAVGRRYGFRYADRCSLNNAAQEHPWMSSGEIGTMSRSKHTPTGTRLVCRSLGS